MNKLLIYAAYKAFNARSTEAVLSLMHPDVQWPNGWEGGYVNGHNEMRDSWKRQRNEIDPNVMPVSIYETEVGRLEVLVHQIIKDKQGALLFDGNVKHIYTITNCLITRMEKESA